MGVIPPHSMPVTVTARSMGRKDALRTSRWRLPTPFTSARLVASTTHAALQPFSFATDDTVGQTVCWKRRGLLRWSGVRERWVNLDHPDRFEEIPLG
jgi:hypothetical protein